MFAHTRQQENMENTESRGGVWLHRYTGGTHQAITEARKTQRTNIWQEHRLEKYNRKKLSKIQIWQVRIQQISLCLIYDLSIKWWQRKYLFSQSVITVSCLSAWTVSHSYGLLVNVDFILSLTSSIAGCLSFWQVIWMWIKMCVTQSC